MSNFFPVDCDQLYSLYWINLSLVTKIIYRRENNILEVYYNHQKDEFHAVTLDTLTRLENIINPTLKSKTVKDVLDRKYPFIVGLDQIK